MQRLFGTDGIRGRFGEPPMTPNSLQAIARALAQLCLNKEIPIKRVLLAEDTRKTSACITTHIAHVLCAQGIEVLHLGVAPTPVLAWMTRRETQSGGAPCMGVMISASHNPACDNGLKFFDESGFKLSQESEAQFAKYYAQEVPQSAQEPTKSITQSLAWKEAYTSACLMPLLDGLRLSHKKVVLDCSHGATSALAPDVFASVGAQLILVGNAPNGQNINHHCGSAHPDLLRTTVLKNTADFGVGFDGDGDRVILCTRRGQLVDGDQLLCLLARNFLAQGRLYSKRVVSTVMANEALVHKLAHDGIELLRVPVGDRFVSQALLQHDLPLGAEPSGHIILSPENTTGDGLLAALTVMHAVFANKADLDDIFPLFTPYPQHLLNIPWHQHTLDLEHDTEVRAFLQSVRADLAQHQGRILVRKSGTEPLLRIMVEAQDKTVAMRALGTLEHFFQDKVLACSAPYNANTRSAATV